MSSRRNPLRRMAMVRILSGDLEWKNRPAERVARSGSRSLEESSDDENRKHGHAWRGHEFSRADSCIEQRFRVIEPSSGLLVVIEIPTFGIPVSGHYIETDAQSRRNPAQNLESNDLIGSSSTPSLDGSDHRSKV